MLHQYIRRPFWFLFSGGVTTSLIELISTIESIPKNVASNCEITVNCANICSLRKMLAYLQTKLLHALGLTASMLTLSMADIDICRLPVKTCTL